MDEALLEEFFLRLKDHYHGYEIVEILEDNGILDIDTVLNLLEEYIIEGRRHLNV